MSSYTCIVTNNLSPAVVAFQTYFAQHPSRAILLTSLAALGVSTPWLIDNYWKFIDLGDYFITNKPIGYLLAMALKNFGRETQSTVMYDQDPDKEIWLKDPDTIPEHWGDRLKTGWHSTPHQQINKFPSTEMKQVS